MSSSQNINNEIQDQYMCNLCNKIAHFVCNNCEIVYYCSKEHQKGDWINHRKNCTSRNQKIKNHLQYRQYARKQSIAFFAKSQFAQAEMIISQLIEKQRQFLVEFPSNEGQIEYASTIFLHIRILINIKDYNLAQDSLTNYIEQKKKFIQNLDHIPEKIDQKSSFYQSQRNFILSKLRMISTLANLAHQLIRTSVSIVEVLIKHIQKFYGPESIQLSNCYFEMGLYFHFLKSYKKAVACFLKAGKLRKSRGGVCYYNAAFIFFSELQQYGKAKILFEIALKLLQESLDNNFELKAYIYQHIAIIYSKGDYYQQCIRNFQTALCLLQPKGPKQHPHYRLIKAYLTELKKQMVINVNQQFRSYGLMDLPKQKSQAASKKQILVNNQNLEKIWNAKKEQQNQIQYQKWRQTFYQMRKVSQIDKAGIIMPQFVEKYLGPTNKQGNILSSNSKDLLDNNRVVQKVYVSQEFMQQLTSIQVAYLHQLDMQLTNCKDKFAAPDIVTNSNFAASINSNQLDIFYRMNPSFLKANLINEQKKSINKSKVKTAKIQGQQITTQIKNKVKKLQLDKLHQK